MIIHLCMVHRIHNETYFFQFWTQFDKNIWSFIKEQKISSSDTINNHINVKSYPKSKKISRIITRIN